MGQYLLDQAEFADNPEPRCPVILLLDTSYSMQGQPINELNAGLIAFSDVLRPEARETIDGFRKEWAERIMQVRAERPFPPPPARFHPAAPGRRESLFVLVALGDWWWQ